MLTLITSYPKSGNTWMRRFLCCYAMGRKIHLGELSKVCPLIYSPSILKDSLDFEPDPEQEIPYIKARPEMYRRFHELAEKEGKRAYLKTHTANIAVNGIPQNLDEFIDKYVFLVRHPLDLIPSYANHMSCSVEDAWQRMQMETFMTRRDKDSPCWELVSSWERHTNSWLELARKRPQKLIVIRYEDMKRQPVTMFQKVLKHLGLDYNEAHFANCLHWSHFETMKAEEQAMEGGYVESTKCGNFFRKGEVGDGKKAVPKEIQDEILTKYNDLLKVLRYE